MSNKTKINEIVDSLKNLFDFPLDSIENIKKAINYTVEMIKDLQADSCHEDAKKEEINLKTLNELLKFYEPPESNNENNETIELLKESFDFPLDSKNNIQKAINKTKEMIKDLKKDKCDEEVKEEEKLLEKLIKIMKKYDPNYLKGNSDDESSVEELEKKINDLANDLKKRMQECNAKTVNDITRMIKEKDERIQKYMNAKKESPAKKLQNEKSSLLLINEDCEKLKKREALLKLKKEKNLMKIQK